MLCKYRLLVNSYRILIISDISFLIFVYLNRKEQKSKYALQSLEEKYIYAYIYAFYYR